MSKCGETMQSMQDPDHIHTCGGEHDSDDHKCTDPDCRRYFWKKGT
jgi:hypothetical protein